MIELTSVFSDGMVIQQNTETVFRGRTSPGATVNGRLLCGRRVIAKKGTVADSDGLFEIPLPGQTASFTPYAVEFASCEDKIKIRNILFGEVWMAAGQSNMELTNQVMENSEAIFAKCKTLRIRAFNCYHRDDITNDFYKGGDYPLTPVFTSSYSWGDLSDGTIYNRSSAAATRALILLAEKFAAEGKEIPIGIVNTSIGGSTIESWLPPEICEGELRDELIKAKHYISDEYPRDPMFLAPFQRQSVLFNTVVAPIIGIKVKGILWYQGCSNNGPCEKGNTREFYKKCLLRYHKEYKRMFGIDGEKFSLICSLLYPWVYGADSIPRRGYIDMGMVDASAENPEIAVAPIYDLPATWSHYYQAHPIHPTNKDGVGLRLGELLLARDYGESGLKNAAYVNKVICHRDSVELRFETEGEYLFCPDDEIKGFYIADGSGNYVPAKAVISSKNRVTVSNRFVRNPRNVAYEVHDTQMDGNLYCGNLPVCPVLTEKDAKIILLPWLEPSVDSHFRFGSDPSVDGMNMFMYPVRYPLGGSAICYDSSYDAIRIQDMYKCGKAGFFVKDEYFLPIDLSPFKTIMFEAVAMRDTECEIIVTFRRKNEERSRSLKVKKEILGTTGRIRFSAPLLEREGDFTSRIDFVFSIKNLAYPTVAVKVIEFEPKK